MKAEERHRLQENELRRLTEHARERSRPFFDRYGTALLLGLAAVLLVVAVAIWWFRSSDGGDSAAWADLAAAFRKSNVTAEDFANVAELHPGTKAAVWAKLYEGEARLDSGIQSLFSDREGASRDLEDAQKAFEAVLDMQNVQEEAEARATYGLARTLEANSSGDLKPALERYEEVTQFTDSVYAQLASERIESLKSSNAEAFYKWFANANPAVRDPLALPSDRGPTPPTPQPGGSGPSFPGLEGLLPPTNPAPGTPENVAPSTPIEAPRPAAAANGATDASAEATPTESANPETPAAESSASAEPQ